MGELLYREFSNCLSKLSLGDGKIAMSYGCGFCEQLFAILFFSPIKDLLPPQVQQPDVILLWPRV